jgi:hypothetical protein
MAIVKLLTDEEIIKQIDTLNKRISALRQTLMGILGMSDSSEDQTLKLVAQRACKAILEDDAMQEKSQ